jgi:hypothetical protein
MVSYDVLYEMFFDIIEKDKDFFQYNNISVENAMMIARQRANRYLKEALSYLSLHCTPDKCGVNFMDYNDEIEILNGDFLYNELDIIANVMYERYLFRDFSKLKAQANRFITKDFNVFSPANERTSFQNMYECIKNANDVLIDHYLSIDRKTGYTKTLDYSSIDE